MATMKAVVLKGDKKAEVVNDRPIPSLRPGYLLVKVAAVALNPTDWKHIGFINHPGTLSGCDYAGTVEKTGTGYTKQWKVGDKICGLVHGANKLQKEDGAFAQYIVVKADIQMRMPANMSFEEAATMGVGIATVGQGMYQYMKLDLPTPTGASGVQPKGKQYLLIYGGSTATGALGVQFGKLSGYTVISTCSKHNQDYVKQLGAEAVFDYNDPNCAADIRKHTNNSLKYAWDTISLEPSAKICADALAPGSGCVYGTLLAVKSPREDVRVINTLAYSVIGDPFDKGFAKSESGVPEDFEFMKMFIGLVDDLLAQGKIKTHRVKVMEGGLDKVLEGLDLLANDKVSGEKLVYKV